MLISLFSQPLSTVYQSMSGYSSIYPHVCLSVHLAICSSIPHFSKKSSPIPLLQKKLSKFASSKFPFFQIHFSNTHFSKKKIQIPVSPKLLLKYPVFPKLFLKYPYLQNHFSNANFSKTAIPMPIAPIVICPGPISLIFTLFAVFWDYGI